MHCKQLLDVFSIQTHMHSKRDSHYEKVQPDVLFILLFSLLHVLFISEFQYMFIHSFKSLRTWFISRVLSFGVEKSSISCFLSNLYMR